MSALTNNIDTLLIFPPGWVTLSPSSLCWISGEVKAAGYKSIIRDLNLEYFSRIMTSEYLTWCRLAVEERLTELQEEFISSLDNVDLTDSKNLNNDYFALRGQIEKYDLFWEQVISKIVEAVKVFRNKEKFYDPKKLVWAFDIIGKAERISSLPFFPAYTSRNTKFEVEFFKEAVEDEYRNPYLSFYDTFIDSMELMNPKVVSIFMIADTQVIPGLTLAKMIKDKYPNIHINISGGVFARLTKPLKEMPEFFETFCHSISCNDVNNLSAKLTEAVVEGQDLSVVSNLLYKTSVEVIKTDDAQPKSLKLLANPSFDGLNLNAYLTPEIVLPISASRGCYWQKCAFCDHFYGNVYDLKPTEKLISEMKYLVENYGIRHYEFIDQAVSASYLQQMSQAILDAGLDVRFFMYARTEQEFTQEVLDLAFKAGCRMILWGIESGSERILKIINKGIDIENRFEPLVRANKAGIWNFAFIFFGFPTETAEEAMMTINMIVDNKDVINCYGLSTFTLGKHTILSESPEKFGISEIKEDEDPLSVKLHYKVSDGLHGDQISTAAELCTAICEKVYRSPLWSGLGYREYLHLYISKYGLEYTKDYSFKDDFKLNSQIRGNKLE